LRGVPRGLDGAYARWVLCFVADPLAVVASAGRRLRRGGTFVIQDYVNYEAVQIAPEHEVFRKFFRAVAISWRQHKAAIQTSGPPCHEFYKGTDLKSAKPHRCCVWQGLPTRCGTGRRAFSKTTCQCW
jgi:SAM-dependent methyltransferase